MSTRQAMAKGNLAARSDRVIMLGHFPKGHWEKARLAPRLAHYLLSLMNDHLEDPVEWGKSVNLGMTCCD